MVRVPEEREVSGYVQQHRIVVDWVRREHYVVLVDFVPGEIPFKVTKEGVHVADAPDRGCGVDPLLEYRGAERTEVRMNLYGLHQLRFTVRNTKRRTRSPQRRSFILVTITSFSKSVHPPHLSHRKSACRVQYCWDERQTSRTLGTSGARRSSHPTSCRSSLMNRTSIVGFPATDAKKLGRYNGLEGPGFHIAMMVSLDATVGYKVGAGIFNDLS